MDEGTTIVSSEGVGVEVNEKITEIDGWVVATQEKEAGVFETMVWTAGEWSQGYPIGRERTRAKQWSRAMNAHKRFVSMVLDGAFAPRAR